MTHQSSQSDELSTSGKHADKLVFECVRCGRPIVIGGYYAKMMSFFDMPKRSGLCEKCVAEGINMVATDSPSDTEDIGSRPK